jgi:peroxiredoxin
MALFAAAVALVCAGVTGWFCIQLLKQNGRILSRLESLETTIGQLAAGAGSEGPRNSLARSKLLRDGLPRGTAAPEFRIPRLGGGHLALSDFKGRPLLLVFSDPHCGPCDLLAPRLERLSRSGVQVVMVSRGDAAANQDKVAQHGLTFPVGLQGHWEISRLYGMFATPIAFLIDEHGIVSAPVATGPDAIMDLVSRAA